MELGTYLGVVSCALSKLAFEVTATDIPEFASNPRLQERLANANVRVVPCNLRDYRLPFDDSRFDIILFCETLEHLNFNPLPVFKEINRVLQNKGLLYLTTPNLASLEKGRKLWQGHSIDGLVDEFAWQLDGSKNMIVGIHWREHTCTELQRLMECSGFRVESSGFEGAPADLPKPEPSWKRMLKHGLHWILQRPAIKRAILACYFDPATEDRGSTIIMLARKDRNLELELHSTTASTP